MQHCPVPIAIRSRRRRRRRDRTRLTGSTTFTGNEAYEDGGAIYNDREDDDPVVTTTTYPSDTVFEGNEADVRRFSPDTLSVQLSSRRKLSLPITVVHMTIRDLRKIHAVSTRRSRIAICRAFCFFTKVAHFSDPRCRVLLQHVCPTPSAHTYTNVESTLGARSNILREHVENYVYCETSKPMKHSPCSNRGFSNLQGLTPRAPRQLTA